MPILTIATTGTWGIVRRSISYCTVDVPFMPVYGNITCAYCTGTADCMGTAVLVLNVVCTVLLFEEDMLQSIA